MNRAAILKTAVCYWSDDDDCYVVESPLFDRTAGVGNSMEEARAHFIEMIDASLADIGSHGLHQTSGRPAKGILSINVQVKPATRDAIKLFQRELKLSSQGEVIDFLAFYYQRMAGQRPHTDTAKQDHSVPPGLVSELKNAVYVVAKEVATNERLERIEQRLFALEQRLEQAGK